MEFIIEPPDPEESRDEQRVYAKLRRFLGAPGIVLQLRASPEAPWTDALIVDTGGGSPYDFLPSNVPIKTDQSGRIALRQAPSPL